MGIEENKAAIERFFREGFNQGDLAVVDEVFASDVVLRGPAFGGEVGGTEGIQTIKCELKDYADDDEAHEITTREQIAQGESVATRYTLRLGEQRFEGVVVSRFADGKIQEYFLVVDEEPPLRKARAHN